MADFRLRATERLAAVVEARTICTAAQIYVSLGGRTVENFALGESFPGVEMLTTAVLPLYCAAKPVIALGIGSLIHDGVLALDEPLAASLPKGASNALAELTVREILSHHAGLPAFDRPTWWSVAGHDVRREFILEQQPRWPRGAPAYCAFVGWQLLDICVENRFEVDLCRLTQERIVDALGVRDLWVRPTVQDFELFSARAALVYVADGPYGLRPEAGELTLRASTVHDPASGARGTCRALGQFYEALLDDPAEKLGISADFLHDWLSYETNEAPDPVMRRPASYGLGLMRGLQSHKFGRRCTSQAFGHSAAEGSAFAFADPAYGLVVAVILNTRGLHEMAVDSLRPMLIDSVYDELELGGK